MGDYDFYEWVGTEWAKVKLHPEFTDNLKGIRWAAKHLRAPWTIWPRSVSVPPREAPDQPRISVSIRLTADALADEDRLARVWDGLVAAIAAAHDKDEDAVREDLMLEFLWAAPARKRGYRVGEDQAT